MAHAYWDDWYLGWGWFLRVGFIFSFFSDTGSWGYTCRAHCRFGGRCLTVRADVGAVCAAAHLIGSTQAEAEADA
jgi:hypothetical protein